MSSQWESCLPTCLCKPTIVTVFDKDINTCRHVVLHAACFYGYKETECIFNINHLSQNPPGFIRVLMCNTVLHIRPRINHLTVRDYWLWWIFDGCIATVNVKINFVACLKSGFRCGLTQEHAEHQHALWNPTFLHFMQSISFSETCRTCESWEICFSLSDDINE